MVLRADDRSLYGKKVPKALIRRCVRPLTWRQGKEGIVIVKTTQAMLICHHPDTVQTPNAATVAEQLADYLISVGY